MAYLYLMLAIVAEVLATSSLKASEEFTRLWPSVVAIVGYSISFYFLALVLKTIPVGIAYAIWSGVGISLVSLVGHFYFKQSMDGPAILGMVLIVSGVMVINLFSRSVDRL